jgi:hypothetical protein
VFAVLKTFWPKRSVTLPTMPQPAPQAAAAAPAESRVRSLAEQVEVLEARVAQLEEAINAEANARR